MMSKPPSANLVFPITLPKPTGNAKMSDHSSVCGAVWGEMPIRFPELGSLTQESGWARHSSYKSNAERRVRTEEVEFPKSIT